MPTTTLRLGVLIGGFVALAAAALFWSGVQAHWPAAAPAADGGKALKGVLLGSWFLDYDQAKAEARRTGKPLFVVFRCEK